MRDQGRSPATYALVAAVFGTLGAAGAVALLVSDRLAASAWVWVVTLGGLLAALAALVAWWRRGPGNGAPQASSGVANRSRDR